MRLGYYVLRDGIFMENITFGAAARKSINNLHALKMVVGRGNGRVDNEVYLLR
jgi:hypothetical protein